MLSPDLLSVDEWAHRLACAECPMPSKPETEAKRTIGAVIAWRADGTTPGLFRLRPKPGNVWATLQDVSDWEEEQITDPVEVRGYSGYVSQATTGHPPYPEPPKILAGGLQVFMVKTQLDPEWDDYNDASSAYGITRLWWEEQLVKAVNAGDLKACDAAKALIKQQTLPPSRAYIKRDHLAAWIAEHQPFKDVGAAFSGSTQANRPQAEAETSPAVPSQPGTPTLNIQRGLPTSTIIRLFSSPDVGKMGISDWKAAFKTPPDWLRKAKRQDGTKGNNSREALWCPLEIAKALVWGPGPQKRRRLTYLQAHRVFEKSDELAPYLDAWLNLAPQREAA